MQRLSNQVAVETDWHENINENAEAGVSFAVSA
jgi:hypothetical protein